MHQLASGHSVGIEFRDAAVAKGIVVAGVKDKFVA